MAREILFRAKRIDNGEWVEGFFVNCADYCDKDAGRIADIVEIDADRIYVGEYNCHHSHKVDINTLCQYTGLTDNNGNKIWENDIVKYHFGDDVATIRYGKYHNCFDSQKSCHVGFFVDWQKGCMRKDLGYWVEMIDCNVIGNIFDHPELLEGGE